eukprot:222468-Alexandrium_andersonii.AAC.1
MHSSFYSVRCTEVCATSSAYAEKLFADDVSSAREACVLFSRALTEITLKALASTVGRLGASPCTAHSTPFGARRSVPHHQLTPN